MIQIIAVKLDINFKFRNYLHWFDKQTITQINSYHFEYDKIRAFASALSKYYLLKKNCSLNLQDIIIQCNSYGKPYLKNANKFFNISHCKDYLVIVISDHEVGIDIEYIDHHTDINSFKEIVFSKEEANLISNHHDLYKLWTKKEAYLKCIGTGFLNNSYDKTNLDLNNIQQINNYNIVSTIFASDYYLSIAQYIGSLSSEPKN